jgi:hypothetical protein
MLRLVPVLALLVVLLPWPVNAQAAPGCRPGVTPTYQGGFADLYAQLGEPNMGFPISCEVGDDHGLGNTVQATTHGLAYYRKFTNTPAFFDGITHWALVPPAFWENTSEQARPSRAILVYWDTEDVDPPPWARPGQGSVYWCDLGFDAACR